MRLLDDELAALEAQFVAFAKELNAEVKPLPPNALWAISTVP
jgi:hypothetical protein